MKSITTKYHGPTNTRGSRVSATDGDGNRVLIGWDDALNSDDNHKAAALSLCAKMDWTGTLAMGALVKNGVMNGNVFVWVYPNEELIRVHTPESALESSLLETCRRAAIRAAGGKLVKDSDGGVIFDASTWEPTEVDLRWIRESLAASK